MWHAFNSLVLAVRLLCSCDVAGFSCLVVLWLGKSSLVVEWEHLSCCIMVCSSSLGVVCWLISICGLRGYSLGVVWSLLSRCVLRDCSTLGARGGASFLHVVCVAPLELCQGLGVPLELRWRLHSTYGGMAPVSQQCAGWLLFSCDVWVAKLPAACGSL